MLKNGLLTDDPATSELSTDMDTDENRTDLNKNILKEKKSKTLKSIKSSKSEDSCFPALAKFICENLEISEFENDKAGDPKTTSMVHWTGLGGLKVWLLNPIKLNQWTKFIQKCLKTILMSVMMNLFNILGSFSN